MGGSCCENDDVNVLSVAVKLPARVRKGDVITGQVYGGCLHTCITKDEMADFEGSGGSVGQ